jgi:hypothetical protein
MFGLFALNDIYQQFAYANHATQPGPSSVLTLAENIIPSQGRYRSYEQGTLSRQLHTKSSPTSHVPAGYGRRNSRFLFLSINR